MKWMELYQDKIAGTIRGLDRIRFRGTLRWLATSRGLGMFMNRTGILPKTSPVASVTCTASVN